MMSLALDPVTVNTELAENYLKTYNNFSSWPAPGKFWHVKRYPDDKQEYDITEFAEYEVTIDTSKPLGPYSTKKIVEKTQDNESLFYQLEYLVRKTDEADVKRNLLLICQHLQCDYVSWFIGVDHLKVFINEYTPLFVLGSVAAAKAWNRKVSIISSQKMAPICHLFTTICAQFGWTINLILKDDLKDIAVPDVKVFLSEEFDACGCTGVVTESADIDSALDVFIDSSAKAPWKIQRIYIQESVYDEVKGALGARCGGLTETNVFNAKGKLFVCDALGDEQAALRVPLEAYRTTRELCALLQEHQTPALSLWAADSQLAHEIAFAASASLVWLNDYASFHGPPVSSLPVYERIYSTFNLEINESVAINLQNRWVAWNKLTKIERVETIMEKLETLTPVPECSDSVGELQNLVANGCDNSFVSVDRNKICFGIQRPVLFEDIVDYESSKIAIKELFNAVINGAALLNVSTKIRPQILEALESAGVPVLWDYLDTTEPVTILRQNIMNKKIKVIRSNFGTIFAN